MASEKQQNVRIISKCGTNPACVLLICFLEDILVHAGEICIIWVWLFKTTRRLHTVKTGRNVNTVVRGSATRRKNI